ncbi:RICIN domain-containing protein [Streptomyces sp. NBC_01136]|uniref:ricin-type beta-trefoil lectin domain protein n=1 Tax=unclassified Streptomyces TaxID=2593676 RepID=UPI00325503F8|nr:RICIN domain-containing protein [Streptomyces sp. NBC_01136]
MAEQPDETPTTRFRSVRQDFLHAMGGGTDRPEGHPKWRTRLVTALAFVVVASGAAIGIGALAHKKSGPAKGLTDAAASASQSPGHGATSAAPSTGPRHRDASTQAAPAPAATGARSGGTSWTTNAPHSTTTTAPAARAARQTTIDSTARRAQPTPAPGGREIKQIASKLCVQPTGGSGARLALAQCTSSVSQLWTYPSDGTVRVNGLCMDAAGSSVGSAVVVRDCSGSRSQHFVLDNSGSHDLTANGLQSIMCVQVSSGGDQVGDTLSVHWCSGAIVQKWEKGPYT